MTVLLQVVDYYKEACRALENSETASMLGKIQKDWKKLVQMKIYYFAAIAHVRGREGNGCCVWGEGGCVGVWLCVWTIHCMYELITDYSDISALFVIQQLHMGKQAEEQQKYGERVGPHFSQRLFFFCVKSAVCSCV